jgi:Ni,Fe-hydrogenase III component G
MTYFSKTNKNNIILNLSSYLTGNYYKLVFNLNDQITNFSSLSNIYSSFTWVERELSEANNINFLNLKDSRRLLSDYNLFKTDTNSYNTNSYNILTQDIYIVN